VSDATPPALINPGAQNSNEGDTVSLQLTATDADHFTASGLPSGLSIDDHGLISGTIGARADGLYSVTITAYDGPVAGSTPNTQVRSGWPVRDTTPPALTSPGNQTSNEGVSISLAVSATDAGHFTASGLPTGLTISDSGLISGTIGARAEGSYAVTLI